MGGLISIPEYAYRFTQSVAKFELLMMDTPKTNYDKDKEKEKAERDSGVHPLDRKMNPNDRALELNRASLEKLSQSNNLEWNKAKLSDI